MTPPEPNPVSQLQAFLARHHGLDDTRRATPGYPRFGVFVQWLPKEERMQLFQAVETIHRGAVLRRHGASDIAAVPVHDRITVHRDWYGISDIYIPTHTLAWLNASEAESMQTQLDALHGAKKRTETLSDTLCAITGLSKGSWPYASFPAHLFYAQFKKRSWRDRLSTEKRLDPVRALNAIVGEEVFVYYRSDQEVDHIGITPEAAERLQKIVAEPGKKEALQHAFADIYHAARTQATRRFIEGLGALNDLPHGRF